MFGDLCVNLVGDFVGVLYDYLWFEIFDQGLCLVLEMYMFFQWLVYQVQEDQGWEGLGEIQVEVVVVLWCDYFD